MNMHDPIVSVEQYEAVQKVLANYKRGMRGGLHYMHVVNMGVFQGYVPINHHWANDDPTEYFNASNSVPKAAGKSQMYRRSQFSANMKVIKKANELNLVSIPGALTPTEIQEAHEFGADFVKLFPITNMGV